MNKISFFTLIVLLHSYANASNDIPTFGYRIVSTFSHDENAFTQGLFIRDGWIYESTGQRGSSSIRKVNLETGKIVQQHNLENRYFGEGIVDWKDRLIAVTWQSGHGFVFGIDDLREQSRFDFYGEGWGLTRSDSHLILSDGTPKLRFLDPNTFETIRAITVTLNGNAVHNLNELEWVEGEIFSNVWRTDWIVRIDPESGDATGLIDLSGLLADGDRTIGKTDVLNGIAYDSASKRLFVTGKNWPKLFEINLIEKTKRE